MKFKDVAALVDGIPYTDLSKGRTFYDFVMDTKPQTGLELGFAHGVSSCYFAAALHELGGNRRLTCVDLVSSAALEPKLEDLLQKCHLESQVEIVRLRSSYTWFLKKKIEENSAAGGKALYDFCFIDGGKNWTIDGAAFFMVDKLLRDDAWLLLDDYAWTYAEHERLNGFKETDGIVHSTLEQDELEVAHVEAIYRLLVLQHPGYSNFRVTDNVLAWAQKRPSNGIPRVEFQSSMSLKYKLVSLAKEVFRAARERRANGRKRGDASSSASA
jgi:predicted O-methyltransferase YrrM